MLETVEQRFRTTYRVESAPISEKEFANRDRAFAFAYPLMGPHGGKVFHRGMFRIFTVEEAEKWTGLMTDDYFDELRHQVYCFCITWQGCVIGVDTDNANIYLFDPATCEYFVVEGLSLHEYLNSALDDVLEESFYPGQFHEALHALNLDVVPVGQSVGYQKSLLLGGEDETYNLELIDSEVMWDVQIQIAESINQIDAEEG